MPRTQNVKNLDEGFLYAVRNQYAGNGLIRGLGVKQMILNYDTETGNYTVGLTVTGGTSGATGVIISIVDNGTDGTLVLDNTSGTFQDNEAITDTSTGAAVVNGVPVPHINEITRWADDVFTLADASVIVRAITSVNGTPASTVITVAQEIDYTGKASGPYTVGETVTESVSLATAIVVADSNAGATGAGVLTLRSITGTWTGGQTITGGTSGATSTGGTFTNRTATFTKGDQPQEAVSVTIGGIALSTTLMTGGATGDQFEILRGLPTYSSSDYQGYVTGKTGESAPETFTARDKSIAQHRKRVPDIERTLSIVKSYLNDHENLLKMLNHDATLIYERDDDRANVVTERTVFLQARNDIKPSPNESAGTEISDVNINMRYERAYTMAG